MDNLADETSHPEAVKRAERMLGIATAVEIDESLVHDALSDLFHLLHELALATGGEDDDEESLDPESYIDDALTIAYRNYRAEI